MRSKARRAVFLRGQRMSDAASGDLRARFPGAAGGIVLFEKHIARGLPRCCIIDASPYTALYPDDRNSSREVFI